MLSKEIKFESFLPPGISILGGKTFVIPGWHEVPNGTTLEEVHDHWVQTKPVQEEKPSHTIYETIDSSKGNKTYEVTFDGTWWNCTCVGFGFRKDCRHVQETKLKHGIK